MFVKFVVFLVRPQGGRGQTYYCSWPGTGTGRHGVGGGGWHILHFIVNVLHFSPRWSESGTLFKVL